MNPGEPAAALQRALALSQQLLIAADSGDVATVAELDAERRRLLVSVRHEVQHLDADQRLVLREIAALNDQALGRMEHRLRAKARDLDMACSGRRALHAYAATRLQR